MIRLRIILLLSMTFIATNILISQGQSIGASSTTYIDIAHELNARYQTVVDSCPGDTPAHYCSGIVIRSTVYSTSYHAWDPSPGALTKGSVSFTYMRSDLPVSMFYHLSGFIFTDTSTAISQGKSLEYRCMYPKDAASYYITDGYGCDAALYTGDINSCDTLKITTAEQWATTVTNIRTSGCSFSTKVASKFSASLDATRKYLNPSYLGWNELMVATWAPDTPNKLPIQAFFYTTAASLAEAQYYQKDFCNSKAHRLVPIVAINFANKPSVFSYKDSDQALTSCPT